MSTISKTPVMYSISLDCLWECVALIQDVATAGATVHGGSGAIPLPCDRWGHRLRQGQTAGLPPRPGRTGAFSSGLRCLSMYLTGLSSCLVALPLVLFSHLHCLLS